MKKLLAIVLVLAVCLTIITVGRSVNGSFEETLMETAEYTSEETYETSPMVEIAQEDIEAMAADLNEIIESGDYTEEEIRDIALAIYYMNYVM